MVDIPNTNSPASLDLDIHFTDEEQQARALDMLSRAIDAGNTDKIKTLIEQTHEADIADQLEQLTSDQREAIADLTPQSLTPEILSELEDEVLEDVLPMLGDAQIASTLEELDSDDATHIVEELDEERRESIMAALPARERAEIEASFAFDEETAGRLMQREFVAAPGFWTVGQVIDHMRAQGDNLPETFYNIYIIDVNFKPLGYVALSQIMRQPRKIVIETLMEDELITIPQKMDQEDVAYQFEKYRLVSAPVVDESGRLCGLFTVDDVIDIIQDENTEDMLALAGVSDAGLTDTAVRTVRLRAPWLLINLVTAIIASFVIAMFGYAIERYVALAILMPIVASMGGNAGTQTLAVAVRALAEREMTRANAVRAVRREAIAGILNGLLFAIVLAVIAWFWFQDLRLSYVIFIAMVVNHICAALAGILVPLGLKKAGADPAVSSSVFVTTVTDVVGFFAFLGTAALLLF